MPHPYTLEAFGSSIVAIGDFNPAILSPDWLHHNQLIGDGDREAALDAKAMVVSRQVSAYETDWFQLQALENRFMLVSKGVLTPALKDLAKGILTLLAHTPVSALGMNFHGHYRMATKEDWHKVGDVLAPKSIWQELFDPAEYSSGLRNLNIGIYRGSRDTQESSPDMRNIQVQPSSQVRPGIYILLNDHRTSFAQVERGGTAAESAAALIAHEWDGTWEFAQQAFENLLNRATEA